MGGRLVAEIPAGLVLLVAVDAEVALPALPALVVARLVDCLRLELPVALERVDSVDDGLRVVVGTKPPPEVLRCEVRRFMVVEEERVEDTLRFEGAGTAGDEGSLRLLESVGMPDGLPGEAGARGIRDMAGG
jgi:hypothetical protein